MGLAGLKTNEQKIAYAAEVTFNVIYVVTAIISLSFVLAKSTLAHLF
jgi:hypothetical protein